MTSVQSGMLGKEVSEEPIRDQHVDTRSETAYKGQNCTADQNRAQSSIEENTLVKVSIGLSEHTDKFMGQKGDVSLDLDESVGPSPVEKLSLGSNSLRPGVGHKRKNQFISKPKVKQAKLSGSQDLVGKNSKAKWTS